MRDDAFSPTCPDDEDGYVPAPGDPSGPRPEYEGHPSYSDPDDRVIGEPSFKRKGVDDDEPLEPSGWIPPEADVVTSTEPEPTSDPEPTPTPVPTVIPAPVFPGQPGA